MKFPCAECRGYGFIFVGSGGHHCAACCGTGRCPQSAEKDTEARRRLATEVALLQLGHDGGALSRALKQLASIDPAVVGAQRIAGVCTLLARLRDEADALRSQLSLFLEPQPQNPTQP